jgi:histidinol-phosphate aminotransferase
VTFARPAVRADLTAMEGYHSPQVEVEVRLNTNESPIPPPAEFVAALAAAVGGVAWHRYPDRDATELRAAIGRRYGLPAASVFAANGSNEVIQSVLLAFGGPGRAAAVFEPTYALHRHIAQVTGTTVVEGSRGADLGLDLDIVARTVETCRPDVVFLCSPNNPTGMVDPPEAVGRVLEMVARYGGLVVVDEAYGQFAPRSAAGLIGEDVPLVVTRTFSKTWSMAALRLGYLLGPRWLVAELAKVALPYHLDGFKQIAGRLALEHGQDMEGRVAALVEERGRLVAGLTELPVTVWPSGANFVLFRPDGRRGQAVWEQLVDHSVLVRNCSSWPGLEDCLRVTIGTRAEDDRFLAALGEVLS